VHKRYLSWLLIWRSLPSDPPSTFEEVLGRLHLNTTDSSFSGGGVSLHNIPFVFCCFCLLNYSASDYTFFSNLCVKASSVCRVHCSIALCSMLQRLLCWFMVSIQGAIKLIWVLLFLGWGVKQGA
jgi:hypothetical protein